MNEDRRRAMLAAHANYGETCACGRYVNGNGRGAHYRACREHLDKVGYPLDAQLAAVVRREYNVPVLIETERRLGKLQLERLGGTTPSLLDADLRYLSWTRFRELVWNTASEAAEEVG